MFCGGRSVVVGDEVDKGFDRVVYLGLVFEPGAVKTQSRPGVVGISERKLGGDEGGQTLVVEIGYERTFGFTFAEPTQ